MKNCFVALVVVLLLVIPGATVGESAPDFEVQTTEDTTFRLSDHRDKPVVIDFMTPDCVACIELENSMKAVHSDLSDDLYFISIDISGTDVEELKEIQGSRDIPWPLAEGEYSLISNYGITQVPTLVVVGQEGEVLLYETGTMSADRLQRELDLVLKGEVEGSSIPTYGIYTLAVIGGLASFFSPCALPLLPSYAAYQLGNKDKIDVQKTLKTALKASLGLILVFGSIGALIIAGGRPLMNSLSRAELLIGVTILLLGITVVLDVDIGAYISIFIKKVKKKS